MFGLVILAFYAGSSEVVGGSLGETIQRKVEIERTITHLQEMGNRTTWDKQWEAARWIAAQFEEIGLQVNIDEYEHQGKVWPNVIAEKAGSQSSKGIIMLIAHLDSIAHYSEEAPGADDNGSGIAVMMQVAQDLAHTDLRYPLVFGVFSNEEQNAAGSRSFAKRARAQSRNIRAVVNIDILGYNRPAGLVLFGAVGAHHSLKYKVKAVWRGIRNYALGMFEEANSVKVVGREGNRHLVETVSKAMRRIPDLNVKEIVGKECGCGDEGSFWSEGYDAVYVVSLYENPYQHSDEDTIQKIDIGMIETVSQAVREAVYGLATMQGPEERP